ncbi:branched-chain amino acid ABC transporter permease [Bradyrhizobium sp. U87765 SZCCT0131]|uniref:branched-chain amino acid ABC transporter permease n=1 Tax=unclassified Bradyrhizobium TaxID=2631580 RepID=UPI001BAB1F41|nr:MULTISPECIES: branched-chain amino acid ABC transporter permease [unclassified Bradyrhizobium]MBR1220413.1 branched-chain amino acid ABC transporter permease [Bradyrhizobium sp. U87765 SZCCT0131]MBR1263132.1 branched-chain amino acid ABC transporter permease [Bradyrhizobium sp. U87765 SZCCT0134]MBR1306985.1 branched-chain amino acid ABC transporter permease [Bradyrhizobium sp. U87765 SZCCT0110]MBR1323127.1 branched-chain amino acid ABC transporter permease [Bradyrhizobium sp. U87765 SZCCT010
MTSDSLDNGSARAVPSFVTLRSAVVVVAIAALLALPMAANALNVPSATGLMTQVAIYAIAAMSLNLVLGYGGLVTFGHAAFFGVGGYVVGILYQHFAERSAFLDLVPGTDSLPLALLAAVVVGAAVAALIGSLSLRTSGVPFIMITLAFAQMLFFLFVSLKTYGGDDGLMMRRRDVLPLVDARDDVVYYYICLVLAAAWFVLTACLVRSRFGVVLSGLRQNERRMIAIGVAPYRYRLVAFIIAGGGAALAGALMTNYLRFASPDMMHWTKSGELMMMVILGGAGTLVGPILGAAAMVVLETMLAAQTENWQLYLGIILLAIVMLTRGGLAALVRRIAGRP